MIKDEPLLSPKRIWFTFWRWVAFLVATEPVYVPLWRMLLYDRRQNAEMRHDNKRKADAQGAHRNPWAFRPHLRELSRWLSARGLHGIVHGSGYQPKGTR